MPGRSEVDGGMDGGDFEIARPGVSPYRGRGCGGESDTGRREGDEGLHGHGLDDAHVRVRHRRTGRDRITGDPVRLAAHLLAVVNAVAYQEAGQPLAAHRARPAGRDHAQGVAVVGRQWCAVHGPGQQRLVLQGLAHRHAARDRLLRRIAGEMRIGRLPRDVDGVLLDAAVLEHVPQAHARPVGTANGAGRPLVAAGGRVELRPAVAPAFELELQGVVLEASLELCQGHAGGPQARLAGHLEGPLQRVYPLRCRRDAVVADEQALARRDGVVEEVCGGLGVERSVVQDPQAVLAGNRERLRGLCERCRNEAAWHPFGKGNGSTERRGHGGQPGAAQEAAPRQRTALAAPDPAVRPDGVCAVERVDASLPVPSLLVHRPVAPHAGTDGRRRPLF